MSEGGFSPAGWHCRRDDGHVISSDRERLDFDFIHRSLAASYWSPGISRQAVEMAAAHSIPFGLYAPDGRQVGYCRVITDQVSLAYLADVWVEPGLRGLGLGKFLVGTVTGIPAWRAVRRWLLFTADAHGLYQQFGFSGLVEPDRVMARLPSRA
ncbi:GNAT family N-acetyltransferase [Niveispirillum sp. BGYR6]|uniref:GNAT family N-acetyltransferase n=1 Tax=Niveispirillum sp. BGYR6 TaxID=2971249 RepID=UPI0022B9750B|nr:GNAT family N-acetyltransferase [Niveispirillum sp. BGYR6]MDG5494221.1 GNAT family N-acetyltransferase [Niveispirillum sp. BGYR6]